MGADSGRKTSGKSLLLDERIRLLRADVEFAAQSFHCWERFVHHWSKERSVAVLNRSGGQLWFRISEWSTLQTTLMALGRLYDRSKRAVSFERVAADPKLRQGASDPARSPEWVALVAKDAALVEKLRKVRNEAIAHRTEDPGSVVHRHGLLVSDVEALVEHAKTKIKWLERAAGLPVIPFHARETVFQSIDVVFAALVDRQNRRVDERAKRVEHYLFVRKLKACPAVKRLIVFGSWARGEQRPGSDIDLAIECEPNTPSQRAAIEAIVEDADTLRRIDVVWWENLPEASPLREAIRKEGQVLKGDMPQ